MFNADHAKQSHYLTILLLVLFSLGLRIHHIDFESLFMDELLQVSFYPKSFTEIVTLAASQQQPPLDYWIGHFITKVWDSDFSVRLPAALFGVGTVLLLFLIISRFAHPYIAVGIGAFVSVLPFHLYFSQHARPYAIAIFFITALLSVLQLILTAKKINWKSGTLLFVVCFFFLMSRTLSPLVSVMGLLIVMSGTAAWSYSKWGVTFREYRKCLQQSVFLMVGALVCYLPFLKLVLDGGGRYANTDLSMVNTLATGLQNFSLAPIWEAFVTQFEPVGYWLVIALIAAYFFWLMKNNGSKDTFITVVFLLLPLVCLLNIFIFQAKSTSNFRPPYAIYLIPFCVILLAYAIQKLFELLQKKNITRAKIIIFAVLTIFFLPTALAMVDSKSLRKATDWRGVSQFLQKQHKPDQLFVFGSLTPERWEPTFFGFPRYYKGKFNGTNFASLQKQLSMLTKASYRPIVILFYHHDYVLTESSPYSFHPAPGGAFTLSTEKLKSNTNLSVEEFTGFYVISSIQRSENSGNDLRFLLEQIVDSFPKDSSFSQIHLSLAALKKALNSNDWEKHLDIALHVASPNYKDTAAKIAEEIRLSSREVLLGSK